MSVSDQDSVDLFMRELSERFVVGEGEAKPVDFLLGMAVDLDLVQGTVSVNMEAYIKRLAEGILTKEELERSKSVDTPMLVTPLPKQSTRTVTVEAFDYLSVVGSLLHASNCVRVDIALAVGILARHAATPGAAHVAAAKRVIGIFIILNTWGSLITDLPRNLTCRLFTRELGILSKAVRTTYKRLLTVTMQQMYLGVQ